MNKHILIVLKQRVGVKKHFTGSGWLTEKAATMFSSENNPVNLSSASHKGYWLWNILLIALARKKYPK